MTPTKADLRIQQSILDGLAAEGIRPHMIVKKGIASADTVSRWQETAKESRRMTLAEAIALADAYGYDKVFGAFAADAGFTIRATTEDEAEADLEDAAASPSSAYIDLNPAYLAMAQRRVDGVRYQPSLLTGAA